MKYYYYINGNMGMTSSGSFSKDTSRWIKFEITEKEYLEKVNKRPYSATKQGMFIEVK